MALVSKPDALKWVHVVGENRQLSYKLCSDCHTWAQAHSEITNKQTNKRKNFREKQQLSSQEAAEEGADS